MLDVVEIVLREIRLPLVEPFQNASGTVTDRRILLVQLIDKDGRAAWGECVGGDSPNYTPETIGTCWLMIRDYLAPRLLGRAFADPREVYPALDEGFLGIVFSIHPLLDFVRLIVRSNQVPVCEMVK